MTLALVDTGYVSNPKWFTVEQCLSDVFGDRDTMPLHTAIVAHLESILYCVHKSTDGVFPVRYVLRTLDVAPDVEHAVTEALFVAGMWHDNGDETATVHDFLDYQTSAADRKERSNRARIAAAARWGTNQDKRGAKK